MAIKLPIYEISKAVGGAIARRAGPVLESAGKYLAEKGIASGKYIAEKSAAGYRKLESLYPQNASKYELRHRVEPSRAKRAATKAERDAQEKYDADMAALVAKHKAAESDAEKEAIKAEMAALANSRYAVPPGNGGGGGGGVKKAGGFFAWLSSHQLVAAGVAAAASAIFWQPLSAILHNDLKVPNWSIFGSLAGKSPFQITNDVSTPPAEQRAATTNAAIRTAMREKAAAENQDPVYIANQTAHLLDNNLTGGNLKYFPVDSYLGNMLENGFSLPDYEGLKSVGDGSLGYFSQDPSKIKQISADQTNPFAFKDERPTLITVPASGYQDHIADADEWQKNNPPKSYLIVKLKDGSYGATLYDKNVENAFEKAKSGHPAADASAAKGVGDQSANDVQPPAVRVTRPPHKPYAALAAASGTSGEAAIIKTARITSTFNGIHPHHADYRSMGTPQIQSTPVLYESPYRNVTTTFKVDKFDIA